MTSSFASIPASSAKFSSRPVTRPHDITEREADRAADTVARGGSVGGWSFSKVPVSAPVHRQEAQKPKTQEDKYKEALAKASEAALETKPIKELEAKVLSDPGVQRVKDAVTSPAGIAVTGALAAGGVAALAATHKELPVQPPSIPLDRITPGLSAQVTYKGPVDAPTFVGLSITYKEQGPKARGPKPSASEQYRAETARLAADQEAFRRSIRYAPGSKEAEEQRLTDEAIAHVVGQHSGVLPGLVVPLATTPPAKKQEEAPVQREPAGAGSPAPAPANVDGALHSAAHPLDPATRRSMESRFGRDFSHVRVHADAHANAGASSIDAAAFTVGRDIVFGPGRYDPASATGRKLLAHELTHVVQQSNERAPLRRKAEPAVSAPYEPAEREADEVADRVVAGLPARDPVAPAPAGAVPRVANGDEPIRPGDEEREEIETFDEKEPETVEAARTSGRDRAPAGFRRVLASTRTRGAPIPAAPLRVLENAFGTSFRKVRVHRDEISGHLTGAIAADAFTSGSHIHVSARAPGIETRDGVRLLAHELAHVRQAAVHGRPHGIVHRTRALYMSSFGRQGFFEGAAGWHRQHGWPAPVEVSSVEEMLDHLVTLPRPLEAVRLVSHALPIGIFLPLLRGGSGSLFAHDLTLQTQSRLEDELATETATEKVGRGETPESFREQTVSHHVVERDMVSTAFTRMWRDNATKEFLRRHHFPDRLTPGGDLETFMWWILDRELVGAERERRTRRGMQRVPVLPGMRSADRAAAVAGLGRNVGIYRSRTLDHLLLRPPSTPGDAAHRRADAEASVAEFEQRLVRVATQLIDEAAARGISAQVAQIRPRYGTVQGALERGTFPNNVLAAKLAISNGMPFDIRGCNIGQNMPWLEAFRDFWGLGAGSTRKRPDVSAPDIKDEFGVRGRTFVEFLHGPRGRRIMEGTAEFEHHIVHAR